MLFTQILDAFRPSPTEGSAHPGSRLGPPRIIVAAGGYRSGSTLQYNLVGEYLERAGIGRRLGYVAPDQADELVGAWMRECDGIGIAKCHHAVAGYRDFGGRDEAWCGLIRQGYARALTTSRRQEEVERSICRKFRLEPGTLHESLEWRENLANAARWREFGAFEQSFEDLTRHPVRSLRAVVRAHGLPWSARAAMHASLRVRRRTMIRHQLGIPTGAYHSVTLIHWDHIDVRPPDERLCSDNSPAPPMGIPLFEYSPLAAIESRP